MPITRKIQSTLLALFIVLMMAQSNHAEVITAEKRERRSLLVGGYSKVETDNLQVIQGAKAVVESLRKGGGDGILMDLPNSSDDGELRIKVLEASTQVRFFRCRKQLHSDSLLTRQKMFLTFDTKFVKNIGRRWNEFQIENSCLCW